MAHVFQRIILNCPYHRARLYLQTAIEPAAISGRREVLDLKVPITDRGNAIEKSVLVNYGRGTDPMHFDEVWTVHWSPLGGPYPDFDGTLTVRCDEDYTSCALELDGEYKPPLGIAGEAFDAIAGARIASATARAVLKEIGSRMERQYRLEEEHKERRSVS